MFYICPVLATNNLGLSSSYFLDDVGIYKITNNTLLNSINQLRSQMSNRWDDQLLREVILEAQSVYCNQSKIFHDIEMINVNKLKYLNLERWVFQFSTDFVPNHQLLLQTAELDSDSENKPLSVNIDKTFEDHKLKSKRRRQSLPQRFSFNTKSTINLASKDNRTPLQLFESILKKLHQTYRKDEVDLLCHSCNMDLAIPQISANHVFLGNNFIRSLIKNISAALT